MKLFLKISFLALVQSSSYAWSYPWYWFRPNCDQLYKKLAYAKAEMNNKLVQISSGRISCSYLNSNYHVQFFPGSEQLALPSSEQKRYEKTCKPFYDSVKNLSLYFDKYCPKYNAFHFALRRITN